MTSLADRLNVEFALIHREKFNHIGPNSKVRDQAQSPEHIGWKENAKESTRLTLVGDVKGKICFLMVCLAS